MAKCLHLAMNVLFERFNVDGWEYKSCARSLPASSLASRCRF